jgi:hypothetical protein
MANARMREEAIWDLIFAFISWFWFCGVWKNAGGATPFYSENFKAS